MPFTSLRFVKATGELRVSILAAPMNGEIMTFIKEVPENIDELVKDANRKHSWKTRLSALNELRKYDCRGLTRHPR